MATTSRPSSPTEDLWSSILDSVSKSRSTPSKQILILGEPRTGKSTLASALLQKQLDPDRPKDDFALGFDWADVRDDTDEDTLARISIYTVQSSDPVHTSLIPQSLPPKNALGNTLAMILLDWTKPWTFVEQLEFWLRWMETWANGDGSRELEVAREEGKEKLLYHLQHYMEPTDEPLPVTTATLASSTLPLPAGTFTSNVAGIPIIVVCTKADMIDDNSEIAGAGAGGMGGMVKSKGGEWEEKTDGVMQVLRTVCLKYGAALFYSTQVPTTTAVLRQYALHYLFLPSPPQPVMGSTDAPAPVRNLFRFTHPANALDRDRIVIPAGWDSWGKIKILRDDFESSRWADAWEKDMESFALARSVNGATPSVGESLLAAPISGGARASFKVLVGSERGPTATSLPPIIKPIPEQTFLQQHYETLAKDPTKAPKAFFEPPVRGDGASISSASGAGGVGVGVVGPLGNNSFILPSVQSALVDMEEAPELEKNKPVRGTLGTKTNPGGGAGTRGPRGAVPPPLGVSQPVSPGGVHPTSGGSPALPQSQHEQLQHFFNSLLSSRTGRGSGSAPANNSSTPRSPNPSAD